MALRTRHGQSKKSGAIAPVLETLPIEELPPGLKGDLVKPPTPPKGLGLVLLPKGNALRPYLKEALKWRQAVAIDLAANVGGGVLSAMCGSLLDSSANALAWSRYLGVQAALRDDDALAIQAGKFAEVSSRLVRECFEYAAREAMTREDESASELRAQQIAFQTNLAKRAKLS